MTGFHCGPQVFFSSDSAFDPHVQDDLFLRKQTARFIECLVSKFILIFCSIFLFFTLPHVFSQTYSLLDTMRILNQESRYLEFANHFSKVNYSNSTNRFYSDNMRGTLPQTFQPWPRLWTQPLSSHACDIATLRKQAWTLGAWTAFELVSEGIGRNVKYNWRERTEPKVFGAGGENLTDLRIIWEDEGNLMLPGWNYCREQLSAKYGSATGGDVISWVCMYAEKQNYPQSCMGRIPITFTSLALGAYLAEGGLQVSRTMGWKDSFQTLDAYFGGNNDVEIPLNFYEMKLTLILKSLRAAHVLSYFPVRYANLFGKQKTRQVVCGNEKHLSNLEALCVSVLSTAKLKSINKPYDEIPRYATKNSPSFEETMPLSTVARAIIAVTSAEKRRLIVQEAGISLANTAPLSTLQYQNHVIDFLVQKQVLKKIGKMRNPKTRRKNDRCSFNKFQATDACTAATTARAFLENLGLDPSEYFATLS